MPALKCPGMKEVFLISALELGRGGVGEGHGWKFSNEPTTGFLSTVWGQVVNDHHTTELMASVLQESS